MNKTFQFPEAVQNIITELQKKKFEAFVVGGCMRDILLGITPYDWDITTNALPDDIQKIFPKSFYANQFGTVTVQQEGMNVEVTTYRSEANYSDKRHPDEVKFGVSLEEDLSRRDFTINAIASDGEKIIDPFRGMQDLKKKIIKAVGDPNERFSEDALRMLRAVRFTGSLRMEIEKATYQAIIKNQGLLKNLSKERIRDEIVKMLMSEDPFRSFWYLYQTGLLKRIIPELLEGEGVAQNKHHYYTILYHSLLSMAYCPSSDPMVKLAALLHDVGKPQTKEGKGADASFHKHEVVGAGMAKKIMNRMKFSNEEIRKVAHLVRHHMFYYSIGEISDAGVRRIIRRVGADNLGDIMDVRIGDRMGSGVQKEKPQKLMELEARITELQKDPITTSMLELDGNDIMKQLGLKPGRMVGIVLHTLLEEVLDNPKNNTKEFLENRVQELKEQALDGSLKEPEIMKEDQKEREGRMIKGSHKKK